MVDEVVEYIRANDNANEYANKLLKDLEQAALEDIDDLFTSLDRRDPELWDELEVDDQLVVTDYEQIEIDERDLDWVLGLAGISAAASTQFFLDNRDDLIIKPAAYRLQKMEPFNLTREQLVRAGKRKFLTVPLETYEALESKYIAEYAFLKDVDNTQLYRILREAKALRPIEKEIADATGYVSRMTSYPPDSPQFKTAVADLVNDSKNSLMGKNRRAIETLNIIEQTGGDSKRLLAWILDPNSKHCAPCPDRAGEVMTYEEWEEDGLPGAEVCAGGDRCNCHLAAF